MTALFLVPKLPLGNALLGSSASRSGRRLVMRFSQNANQPRVAWSPDESRSGASKTLVPKRELGNEITTAIHVSRGLVDLDVTA